ncbi:MAG: hydrogenase maturation protease [bacterium]|nr:hydrogenase maturation protease [bacterium]
MNGKNLVLGIGNDILMDDGIGPRVVQILEEESPMPDVTYATTTLGGLDILECINGYRKVVFVDAIKTKNGIPGTVYEFTPADFRETMHLSNLHDISFLSALELGKRINYDVPEDITILAIEIVEDRVFGEAFTPQLQARFDGINLEIRQRVMELLSAPV